MLKFKQQLEKTVLLSQISVSQNKDLEDALEASKESLKQSQVNY